MNRKLNPEQLEAVNTIKGSVLIFAGAGTGKTRVITHRIAHLISSGISPENILAVTFTNKAANEMKERVGSIIGKKIAEDIHISTFHSLGAYMLRKNYSVFDLRSNFSIYTNSESVSLVKKVMKEELSEWQPGIPPSDIFSIISKFRLNSFSTNKLHNYEISDRFIKYLIKHYTAYLRNCNAVDFDDLIYLPLEILKNKEILESYQEKFKYIMVDEFQDTNDPQYALIKLLASKYQNICVVGDDDQSIYAFRGSNQGHILNFQKSFTNVKTIKLEQNYRSTETILNAAYSLVKNNKNRADKKLWSTIKSNAPITLMKTLDEKEESRLVISQILSEKSKNNFEWNDIAILYRTNNQSRSLEEELISKKIPYKIIGGTNFFDRKEIRDIAAYLKTIFNPNDETALYRIINIPSRGIGQQSIEKINKYCLDNKTNFFQGLLNINKIEGISGNTKTIISSFTELLMKYKQIFQTRKLSDGIKSLIEEISYKTEIEKHHFKLEDVEEKYANCLELVASARDFEKDNPTKPNLLQEFLERISLITDEISSNKKKEKEFHSVIKLMTLHNSKGLEFPYVSIVGLNETILPHERSITPEAIEEERRLLYVGITRAQRKLVLSYSTVKNSYGKQVKIMPSRFLNEIPDTYVDDLSKQASKEDITNIFSSLKARFS